MEGEGKPARGNGASPNVLSVGEVLTKISLMKSQVIGPMNWTGALECSR